MAAPGERELAEEEREQVPIETLRVFSLQGVALRGIFALLLAMALYFARSVALPVALAILASLVLAPVVRALAGDVSPYRTRTPLAAPPKEQAGFGFRHLRASTRPIA